MNHFVSIRTNNWKYTVYDNGSEEFYDLCHDPDETHNIFGEIKDKDTHQLATRLLLQRLGSHWIGPKPGWWDNVRAL